MEKTKELAQAPAKAPPVRQPETARRGPEPSFAPPVFSAQARSNGVPAAARAAEMTSAPGGTASRARMASSLQRSLGNARMSRMMAHGGPAGRPAAGGAGKIPSPTQEKLEGTFGAPLDFIDVHGGGTAAEANRRMGSRAFAHGSDIYLGPGESPHDTGLMAHEVAHVFQQQGGGPVVQRKGGPSDCAYEREADRASAAALRSEHVTIHERTGKHRPQFWGMSDALNLIADKANVIPGYRMFTIVLGVNPINMAHVERSAGNILRAVVEFIPGGGLITQVADAYGAFDKIAKWVEPQIAAVSGAASSIKAAVDQFLGTLKLSDILDPGGVWDRAKSIFTTPVNRVLNVAKGLLTGILALFRDVILMPLVGLAEKTRGWDLLIAVLGKNPITGAPVPRTAETLVPGFLKLIGEEETWNNIKKANALARCWAWFQGALGTVMGFVQQIPTLFINALKSLELEDILILPKAFAKVAGAFGDFVGNFITWAGKALWNLLQIIFEVLAPAAIPYMKKVGAAFQKILKNPMGFVGNLVKAGKQGFLQFADHIGAHLKASFIEWLTGSLDGVYIPKSFDFKEIAKFVLSVLGLTWENIRKILVKIAGETAVKAMELGFDLVKTLVTEGPAAAWEKIKEQLGNLKDMVMQGIMDFIIETVVKKAIAKIVAWLIPGAGFIDAIITIYDTIIVFIDKLKKIIAVATAFLDGIVNIANGVIGAAANKVESTMAGLLTLAISFLAGIMGLNKITAKINEILNTKVRGPILKAVEFVANWVWNMAKKFMSSIKGAAGKVMGWLQTKVSVQGEDESHVLSFSGQETSTDVMIASAPMALEKFLDTREGDADQAQKKVIADVRNQLKSVKKLIASSKPGTENEALQKKIETEMNALGAKIAPLLSGGSLGSKSNPAPVNYEKRRSASYPVFYLATGSMKGLAQNTLKDRFPGDGQKNKIWRYLPNGKQGTPGGEETLGLDASSQVEVGLTVRFEEKGRRGGGVPGFKSLVGKYGLTPSDQGWDVDHVLELQVGGKDEYGNLWPLPSGENRSSGSIIKNADTKDNKGKTYKVADLFADLKKKGKDLWMLIASTRQR
jgi:Domain of unknown function (DUF4157)